MIKKRSYILVLLLSLFYALIMVRLLFIRDGVVNGGIYRYNLVPFETISNYVVNHSRFNFDTWFKNLFGNIIMFIPIGLFAPLLSRRLVKFFPFIGFTFVLIGSVETLQLILRVGSFDVDDIILNLTGAIIGYIFLRSFRK